MVVMTSQRLLSWRGFAIRALFNLKYYIPLSLLCIGTDCKSAPAWATGTDSKAPNQDFLLFNK